MNRSSGVGSDAGGTVERGALTGADVVSRHVESGVRHLMDDLDLRSLLALTHQHAPAGQAAIDLVMLSWLNRPAFRRAQMIG